MYDVERWIRAGMPQQVAKDVPPIKRNRATTALEIALEDGSRALALLLLCNGYVPNLEFRAPRDRALRSRRWDLLDMLLDYATNHTAWNLSTHCQVTT